MREFVFALEYEPGCNRVADALADHPDAGSARCRCTRPTTASGESTTPPARRTHSRTSRTPFSPVTTTRTVSRPTTAARPRPRRCSTALTTRSFSTPTGSAPQPVRPSRTSPATTSATACCSRPATRAVTTPGGSSTPARATRRRSSRPSRPRSVIAPGRRCFERRRRIPMRRRATRTVGRTDSLPNRRAALRAAVEHGYYESPREIDAGDLADHLDIPRSTLTYRLRRAEEHLAKQHVASERATGRRAVDTAL